MKIRLLLILSVISAAAAMAQQTTTPYSMYGYGILSDRASSMQRQMGSVGYALHSGRQINVMNPASYAGMDSLTFLFDLGADLSILDRKEGDVKEKSTGGGLDYITMQFPLSKHIGASIGLLPWSSVGYSFGQGIKHGALQNQGSGGINLAYAGIAGRYGGLAVGANIAYSFGNIINDYFAMPHTSGQTLVEHVMQVRDWDIVFGVQYTHKLNRYNHITAGLTYTPKKSLHGNTYVTTQETTLQSVADTVAYMNLRGNFETPNSYGFGVSYTHERNSRWMAEADITYQQWSKVKYSGMYDLSNPNELVFEGMKFSNRKRYAVGGEYTPNIRGNYLQRMVYRIGAFHTDDYLLIQGNRLKENGFTCGFGFNTPEGKTMINLGFEYRRRRGTPNPMISENYYNITLGLNFNEMWFWQRKIR